MNERDCRCCTLWVKLCEAWVLLPPNSIITMLQAVGL